MSVLRTERPAAPRVERLVVVAGPPAAGKSTTIRQLTSGGLLELRGSLDLGDPAGWRVLEARDLHRVRDDRLERVILHYDFLRQWKRTHSHEFGTDQSLAILKRADEISFVTLWAQPATLIRRLHVRRAAFHVSRVKPWRIRAALIKRRRLDNFDRLEALYANQSEVSRLYEEWVTFCEAHTTRAHFILDTTDAQSIMRPTHDWLDLVMDTVAGQP